jgi:3-oxoacyl-[acyl-carrier protein] reductase
MGGRRVVEGRVALVTGGGRGIGRAIAVRLAREGARVAISYRSNDAAAEETVELVRKAGVECETFKGDVASLEDVEALMKGVGEAFGAVEILVNNAGTTRDNILLRMKDAEFDEVLATNLKGTYLCTRAALRGMVRARWGRIVNISSVVGLLGNAGQANYAASKAGIIGFTKSVAREVAGRGITANAVAPGYVETELTGVLPENIKEQILGQVPMGRLGEPEEIAEVVMFLAGERAAYVTGQTIAVDGGMVMQ